MYKVIKRDEQVVVFDIAKITEAIERAFQSLEKQYHISTIELLALRVTADFESKYKFAPPYPDQDEQYILQVTKKATYQDGNLKAEWTFPKAYFEKEGSIVLSNATLIGNGSFGDVRLELNYNETKIYFYYLTPRHS